MKPTNLSLKKKRSRKKQESEATYWYKGGFRWCREIYKEELAEMEKRIKRRIKEEFERD